MSPCIEWSFYTRFNSSLYIFHYSFFAFPEHTMKSGTWQFPVFAAGLIMGTGSTLVVKALYQTEGTDYHGKMKPFEKPLFITFMMFVGTLRNGMTTVAHNVTRSSTRVLAPRYCCILLGISSYIPLLSRSHSSHPLLPLNNLLPSPLLSPTG